jgi:sugar transferase (PEP-CTERM system associated)
MVAITGRLTWRRSLLIAMDHAVIVAAVLLAFVLRMGIDHPHLGWSIVWRASIIAMVLQLCLHYCDLYDVRTLHDRRDLEVRLFQALGAGSLIVALLYYWVPPLILGRGVFLIGAGLILLLVIGWRMAFEWLSARVGPAERLLILGTDQAAITLARELFDRRHDLGVEIVGFVDADQRRVGAPVINPGVIGAIADIPAIVSDRKVDRVVVSVADLRGKLSMEKLLDMRFNDGVRFDYLASVYEEYTGKIAVENLRPSWLIFSDGFRKTRTLRVAKRAMDVALATVGLALLWPVMALVALGIQLTSPGPVFYHQDRVGQYGRVFRIHKFRSMYVDAEKESGAVWSRAGDPRVTPLGRVLRRTRLDELPQMWNVLMGDMSVVGPRPERPFFVSQLKAEIPFYNQRHALRPGLTGWAQIRHSYGATVDDALQKLQYDLFYIKHMSIAFDLFVIVETVKTVLVRSGS